MVALLHQGCISGFGRNEDAGAWNGTGFCGSPNSGESVFMSAKFIMLEGIKPSRIFQDSVGVSVGVCHSNISCTEGMVKSSVQIAEYEHAVQRNSSGVLRLSC